MHLKKTTDILEVAVHVIIVLLGIIVLFSAYGISNIFWQSLLINIGSSLVVVTILFFIFEIFRRRHEYKDNNYIDHEKSGVIDYRTSRRDIRAINLMKSLQEKQNSSVTTNTSKVGHKN